MNQPPDLSAAPTLDEVPDLVPFLPAPALPTPSAAPEPPVFDAAAMVESQRVGNSNPAYGALPAGTDGGREAANELRAKAQKKRRHNKRLGQMVVVVMLIGMGGIGYLVFRAFQEGQVEQAEVTETDGGSDAITPLGEQNAVNDAIEDLNSVTPGESGGLIGAIDDARDLTQVISPAATLSGPDAPVPLPNPRVASRPDFRTIDYTVRMYDGVQPGATFRNFDVTYDTLTDEYFGFTYNTATDDTELVSFRAKWRYTLSSEGTQRRVRRSAFSRSVEPDTPLASLLAESDVFPSAARPFATLVSEDETGELGLGGSPLTAYAYFIDVAGFREADPGSYATWRTLWATAPHDIIDLVEPGTAQVRTAAPPTNDALAIRPLQDWSELEVMPVENQTAVLFVINEQGVIELASLISPEENLRIVYAVRGYGDEGANLPFPKDGWSDAP